MPGLSTRGIISFGSDLLAGRRRVPYPAAGITAFRTLTRSPYRRGHSRTSSSYTGLTMPQTILVIEDEATIAAAVAARLEKEGFEVLVAGDGLDGIERFRTGHPDLVVLDLMLPGMDGLEVCRRIQ